MSTYVIRRLLFGLVLTLLATVVSFAILRLSPGEVGATELDPRLSPEYLEQQKRVFGLDQSPVRQYLNWIGLSHLFDHNTGTGLLQGNLGLSITFHQPVSRVVAPRLGATLVLNLIALGFTWLIAIPLGIYAAVNQYRWADRLLSGLGFVGMSLPGFFLALLVLWLLASRVHLLPPGGLRSLDHNQFSTTGQLLDYARHMIVPVVVLVFGALAGLQRITRGNMLETLRQQYVVSARAKGLSETRVIYKHALRNAINPLVTILGFEFAGLFSGAALLENVINYPGIGQLMLQSLQSKDQFLVLDVFTLGAVMLVIGNLLAELLLAWVDPRVRYD